MKRIFSKAAFLVALALSASAATFAQGKIKVEDKNYELKVKSEGKELKYKESGIDPRSYSNRNAVEQRSVTTVKTGDPIIIVKPAAMPAAKTTTAAQKPCSCATKTAARKSAVKHKVAYKPKARTTNRSIARVAPKPVVLHDTVFVTRVDTVFHMIEQQSFAGYGPKTNLRDDFKKLKIKRESNGEIEMKKEYENGREEKRTFSNEDDFNTYMMWKNY